MDNVFACENCGKKFLAKEVLQHDAYCPCGETIIAYSIDAADRIAELEAQLAAAQERISNALKICNSDFNPLRVYDIKKTLEATNDKEIR